MSEICGKMTLESDIASRTLGFNRIAKQNWEVLDNHMKSLIRSYVVGVNAVITAKNWKIPVELKLLKYKNPRP